MPLNVGMKDLLEAGVHFGHQKKRWNPKMKPYIYTERNDIFIIDLQKTLMHLEKSYEFVKNLAAEGGMILFVGTKKQAQDSLKEQAERAGMPYVNYRWLGGMLTNWQTISSRLEWLFELERMKEEGIMEQYPKKERMSLEKELEKLQRNLGGIREMNRLPDALFVIDTKKEEIAVKEARKLGLTIVAVVDTNCDPDEVDWIIPGNDDAIRAASLMSSAIADAVIEGKGIYESKVAELEEEEEAEGPEVMVHTYEPSKEEKKPHRRRAIELVEEEEMPYEGVRVFEPEEYADTELKSAAETVEEVVEEQAEEKTKTPKKKTSIKTMKKKVPVKENKQSEEDSSKENKKTTKE